MSQVVGVSCIQRVAGCLTCDFLDIDILSTLFFGGGQRAQRCLLNDNLASVSVHREVVLHCTSPMPA